MADLYSLGKLLYEMSMEMPVARFPELPTFALQLDRHPLLMRLNEVLVQACDNRPARRFQSAEAMYKALSDLLPQGVASPGKPSEAGAKAARVAILYKSHAQPDLGLMQMLEQQLTTAGFDVFIDRHLSIGVEWAQAIENKIRQADAVIPLLSGASTQSEMVAYEVEIAHHSAQEKGAPRILPVRVQYDGVLPAPLAAILDPLHYFLWHGPQDDAVLVDKLVRALRPQNQRHVSDSGSTMKSAGDQPSTTDLSEGVTGSKPKPQLESVGGAVPLDSRFYVERPTDREFQTAIARRDSIVLVKGARQMGKTSLLARGLQQARTAGSKVVLTDFQKLNTAHLGSVESFFRALGEFLADQLDLEVLPEQVWDTRRSPNTNFERYLRREVLGKLSVPLIWGLDEVDRLFSCAFGSEVFGLFRSWHNERALDPGGPWSRLTLVIAYATEAHLFITDVNQSPFNVGTRLSLSDFTLAQVADLNERYGSPLRNAGELEAFYQLLGGQPYLVRRALNEMSAQALDFAALVGQLDKDEGIFGDHLRRMLVLLAKDAELCEVVRGVLRGQLCPGSTSFYRLRSAGVMRGDAPTEVRPRCQIYASYLKQRLL
jgi:hypothetical protein